MYYLNEETRSVWYKRPDEENLRFIGYEKDFRDMFDKLNITVESLQDFGR